MVFEDWYTISQVPQTETPPSQIPKDQVDRFSLNGYAALQTMYFNDNRETADHPGNWDNITCLMKLSKTDLLALSPHKEAESIYNAMDNFPLDGMRGLVVGSTSQPWLEVMVLQHGARNVVTIQRNKFNIQEEFRNRISAIFPVYLANNWQKFVRRLDFAASFSSIQHTGLGRYGDPIDPIGDLREMQKIKCMLKKGGILFLGVPFGTDAIHFNAQRYYGPIRLAMLFQGFEWVATYSADSEKRMNASPLFVNVFLMLVRNADVCVPTQQVTYESLQDEIQLLQAGVPLSSLSLTPAEAAALAVILATTQTTTLATTTTVTTTTTTATTTTSTPYPCSVCTPIYDASCQGENLPSPSMYCLIDDEVPITYTLGFCSVCGVSDACQTQLGCPAGTAARLDTGGGDVNGNSDGSPTQVYCSESIGSWYGIIDGVMMPVTKVACKYP
ncbi:hypothetical protein B9Z55_018088 [Caenorhabditis nigoni]|nr:hypothetical protein B9Z55_018088 [Caenorhabditis nigoni]